MITEKQKTIAEQVVYGDLKGKAISGLIYPIKCSYDDVVMVYESSHVSQEDIKPILRPLDLTKEITHKGYNDDKPFIPLVELAKTAQESSTTAQFKLQDDMVVDFTIGYHFKQNVMWFKSLQGDKRAYILPNQNKYFDLLHLWHFDTRGLLEKSKAISTDEVNPYEVK